MMAGVEAGCIYEVDIVRGRGGLSAMMDCDYRRTRAGRWAWLIVCARSRRLGATGAGSIVSRRGRGDGGGNG